MVKKQWIAAVLAAAACVIIQACVGDTDPTPSTAVAETTQALKRSLRVPPTCEECEATRDACLVDCSTTRSQLLRCQSQCDADFDACANTAGCGEVDGDGCWVASSALDIDVPRVQISGDFTVNNAAPSPFDSQTARIELRNPTLGVVDLGTVNLGSYTRWIIPGVYDVVYMHIQGDLLPQNAETVLQEDVDLASGGTFDIAIDSVLVMGDVLVNGAPAPASIYENGHVKLRDRNTGASFEIGESRDGSFAAMVIPGDYDIVWSRLLGDSTVPMNGDAAIVEELTVAGLTEVDVDIPAVVRTGSIEINGAPPPASIYENGVISLRDTESGDVFPAGETRDQSYEVIVVPGHYDVLYSHLIGDSEVPLNALAVIAENVDFTTGGVLDVDVPMVALEGVFSLDGGDFPASAYDRARFWLLGEDGEDLFSLGTTEARSYEVQVIPGTYSVIYEDLLSTGVVPENPWSVVSTGNAVAPSPGFLKSSHPASLDIEVASGWLDLGVTVWGQAPLHSVYNNAELSAFDGTGDPVPVGTIFDGGGSVRVIEGSYDILYAHLIGDEVAANTAARVGTEASEATPVPVDVDLQHGDLAGAFTQGGVAFPADPAQRGRLSLRDAETGALTELAETDAGGYDRRLLGGSYDLVYDQVEGDDVVANRDATLGCVSFDAQAPLE